MQRAGELGHIPEECIETLEVRDGDRAARQGALVVRAYKGTPFYEAKWRNAATEAAQAPARASVAGTGRRGRLESNAAAGSATGYLDERGAYREMSRADRRGRSRAANRLRQSARPSSRTPSTSGSSTSRPRSEPSPPRSPATGACSPSRSHGTANGMARASCGSSAAASSPRSRRGRPSLPGQDRPRRDQRPHRQYSPPGPALDLRARPRERHLRAPRQPGRRDHQAPRGRDHGRSRPSSPRRSRP